MAYVKKRQNRTFVNLDGELKERVKKIAEEKNKPMGTLLYEIIKDYMENNIFDFEEIKNIYNTGYIIFRGSTIIIVGKMKENPIVKKRIDDYIEKNKNTYKLYNVIYADIADIVNIEVEA